MTVWQSEKRFVALLERKKEILQGHIIQVEKRISIIYQEIQEHQQEQAYINQQIKLLTPSGILARTDIYRGIRRQGSLLSHLQMVVHKITQLEDEKNKHQKLLEEYHLVRHELDKRLYKLARYLQMKRQKFNRRYDNNTENEIQEMAIYDRKKI